MLGVQPFLALLDARDLRLEHGELRRRLLATLLGGGQRLAQASELGLRRLDPAAAGRHLAGEPGDALAAVGGTAQGGGDLLLGGRRLGLGLLPRGDGRLERGAGQLDLAGQLGLGRADALGLGGQVVGVGAAGALLPGAAEQADPVGGQGRGAAQALAQGREPVPDLAGLAQGRCGLGGLALERGQAGAGGGQGALDLLATDAQRALVGDLLLERGGELREVVGEQPGAGVAQVGLDDRGLAGDLRLPAERAELAADLPRQVTEPRQVGLHGLELAERLLLALAVLEDARGLLDEPAALLGRRAQHRVELALADDDVHLAAQAGVGQQVLDVEEPAALPVDRVLGPAVAEQRPRDGDLGVLDRQRAVGVVDGERDLGAAQRRAARRCPRR